MTERTLKQAFNAVFHDEAAYDDFCRINIEKELQTFRINDRIIFKTSDTLKKYLRFIDRVVLRSLRKDDDVAHSFIKGKSTLTALQSHTPNKYFFLTDIEDFYTNVTSNDVDRILKRDADVSPISDLRNHIGNPPENWCCSEVEYSHNGATGDSTCVNHALATTRF